MHLADYYHPGEDDDYGTEIDWRQLAAWLPLNCCFVCTKSLIDKRTGEIDTRQPLFKCEGGCSRLAHAECVGRGDAYWVSYPQYCMVCKHTQGIPFDPPPPMMANPIVPIASTAPFGRVTMNEDNLTLMLQRGRMRRETVAIERVDPHTGFTWDKVFEAQRPSFDNTPGNLFRQKNLRNRYVHDVYSFHSRLHEVPQGPNAPYTRMMGFDNPKYVTERSPFHVRTGVDLPVMQRALQGLEANQRPMGGVWAPRDEMGNLNYGDASETARVAFEAMRNERAMMGQGWQFSESQVQQYAARGEQGGQSAQASRPSSSWSPVTAESHGKLPT